MKKILLICNDSNTVINFRKELIRFLLEKDFNVYVIAGDRKREEDIKKLGVTFSCIPFSNRSKSIFSSMKLVSSFKKEILKIAPDIVLTFQIKPNIFGAKAAKSCKISNIYCMIEGLGDPFQPKNFKGKILRILVSWLYRKSLKHAKKVFFLNRDDKDEFIKRKIISNSKIVLIPGIGIDTKKYIATYKFESQKKVVNLSRLIKNKGIIEYCEIARLTRKFRPDIIFELYGEEDELTKADLQSFISDGSIVYSGYSNDAASVIANATFIVSTSYREGCSRVIMEAMAMGRPSLASNVIGNRDLVIDKETGYLLDLHDLNTFVECILNNIDDNELLIKIGKKARQICEEKYDSTMINKKIVDIISTNN